MASESSTPQDFAQLWAEMRTAIPGNRRLVSEVIAMKFWNAALNEAAYLVNSTGRGSVDLRQIRKSIRDLGVMDGK